MRRGSRRRKIKYGLPVVLLLVLLTSTVTFAYLQWKSSVENTFTQETAMNPEIKETFDGETKKNVYVQVGDTGYSVYVRAAVVVTWASATGETLGDIPKAGTDYNISENLAANGWFKGSDGFYYYAKPVESGQTTEILINEIKPLKAAPVAEYRFNVEVVAQTIQAAGTTDGSSGVPAVTDAWKMDVNSDGNLTN